MWECADPKVKVVAEEALLLSWKLKIPVENKQHLGVSAVYPFLTFVTNGWRTGFEIANTYLDHDQLFTTEVICK